MKLLCTNSMLFDQVSEQFLRTLSKNFRDRDLTSHDALQSDAEGIPPPQHHPSFSALVLSPLLHISTYTALEWALGIVFSANVVSLDNRVTGLSARHLRRERNAWRAQCTSCHFRVMHRHPLRWVRSHLSAGWIRLYTIIFLGNGESVSSVPNDRR